MSSPTHRRLQQPRPRAACTYSAASQWEVGLSRLQIPKASHSSGTSRHRLKSKLLLGPQVPTEFLIAKAGFGRYGSGGKARIQEEYTIRTKPNESILLAEEQVQFIDERLISVPGRVFQRLWPSPWVIVEVSGVTRDPKPIPPSSPTENFLSFPHSSEGPHSVQKAAGAEVVPSSWMFGQQDAELHLKYSPSVAFSSGEPIVNLEFSATGACSTGLLPCALPLG